MGLGSRHFTNDIVTAKTHLASPYISFNARVRLENVRRIAEDFDAPQDRL